MLRVQDWDAREDLCHALLTYDYYVFKTFGSKLMQPPHIAANGICTLASGVPYNDTYYN